MNQLSRCDRLIQIRAPEFLTKALDSAAGKRLTSRSDYIRTVLLDRLKVDGVDPTQEQARTVLTSSRSGEAA